MEHAFVHVEVIESHVTKKPSLIKRTHSNLIHDEALFKTIQLAFSKKH